MCGRITQHTDKRTYAANIGWDTSDAKEFRGDRIPHYNLAPSSFPWLMHKFFEGKNAFDTVPWGYSTKWGRENGINSSANATIEKAKSPYWRALWKSGRAVLPIDGWYEWTGTKGHRQPWYIRLKTDKPMFVAALTNFRPYQELPEGHGFVIVTTAAEGGLVDVHDRRPIVFTPEDARHWMDASMDANHAEQLARAMSLSADYFEWFKVTPEVNKAGNNEPYFIEPIP